MSGGLNNSEILTEIDSILASPYFSRSRNLSRFLRFVVEQTLAGQADDLKEYTIGIRVFERGESFDPRIDPIVRVQANKLRERLDRYYHHEGSTSGIRLKLRPGSYVPAFETPTEAVRRNEPVRASETPSLAVLPFLNLTGDPEFEYFSDGLSEELIGVVGRITGLRVIARTSSFAFKGTTSGLEEIGRTLRTNLVLEGSVRRSAGAIRVTARLNDVPSGHQIWTRQFDRSLENVFAVQDEIAGQIAGTVHESFDRPARLQPSPRVENLESYRLYLQAWHHWQRNTPESMLRSLDLFESAVMNDPDNAKAQAGLVIAYCVLATFGVVSAEIASAKAIPAAEQAVAAGSDVAEAWQALGSVRSMLEWEFEAAADAYERSIKLNPSYALARHAYAVNCLATMGRADESVAEMRRAVDLDPLSLVANCDLGTLLFLARSYEASIEQYQKALDLDPHYSRARFEMVYSMLLRGDILGGLTVFDEHAITEDSVPHVWAIRALALALAGKKDESEKALEDFRARCPNGEFVTSVPAYTLDVLGLRDEALRTLERQVARRDPQLRYLAVDPFSDRFRGEPRFEQLLRQMNLVGPDARR